MKIPQGVQTDIDRLLEQARKFDELAAKYRCAAEALRGDYVDSPKGEGGAGRSIREHTPTDHAALASSSRANQIEWALVRTGRPLRPHEIVDVLTGNGIGRDLDRNTFLNVINNTLKRGAGRFQRNADKSWTLVESEWLGM